MSNTRKRKRKSKAKCKKQNTKKYMSRPSPPYPARLCFGQTKKGNDGNMYISQITPNYSYVRWIKK
jgi:hypothetical protein